MGFKIFIGIMAVVIVALLLIIAVPVLFVALGAILAIL